MTVNDSKTSNYGETEKSISVKEANSIIEKFHGKHNIKELVEIERLKLNNLEAHARQLAEGKFDSNLASIVTGCVQGLTILNEAERKIDSDTIDFDRDFFQTRAKREELERALDVWKNRQSPSPNADSDIEIGRRYRETALSVADDPNEQMNEELQNVAAKALSHADNALSLFGRAAKEPSDSEQAKTFRQEGYDEIDLCAQLINEACTLRGGNG